MESTRIEWAEDEPWDEDVCGERPCDVVTVDEDGVEVSRVRCLATYAPSEPGDKTSGETQADIDELVRRRSSAIGRPVVVAAFSSTGRASVYDVEDRDGESELVLVADDVYVTPSES